MTTPVETRVKPDWTGRFYEDFEVGDIYRHPLGCTISETDSTWFTLLTMNTAEPHFNVEAGKASEFGKGSRAFDVGARDRGAPERYRHVTKRVCETSAGMT